MARKLSDRAYLIEKLKDGTTYPKGYRTVYTGNIKLKPKGWKVIREL
jgi:hypothetical protein